MKYNKGNLSDTMRVATLTAKKRNCVQYVSPTAYGLLIDEAIPAPWLQHYVVSPDGACTYRGGWAGPKFRECESACKTRYTYLVQKIGTRT